MTNATRTNDGAVVITAGFQDFTRLHPSLRSHPQRRRRQQWRRSRVATSLRGLFCFVLFCFVLLYPICGTRPCGDGVCKVLTIEDRDCDGVICCALFAALILRSALVVRCGA